VFFKEKVARATRLPRDRVGSAEHAPASPTRQQDASAAAALSKEADDEYAATGMGRRTGHVVQQVWLDLEPTPAQTVNIRYEFRSQLVRLGILPTPSTHPLDRRERARGFEAEFAPVR
jgi:hypothetical protein